MGKCATEELHFFEISVSILVNTKTESSCISITDWPVFRFTTNFIVLGMQQEKFYLGKNAENWNVVKEIIPVN